MDPQAENAQRALSQFADGQPSAPDEGRQFHATSSSRDGDSVNIRNGAFVQQVTAPDPARPHPLGNLDRTKIQTAQDAARDNGPTKWPALVAPSSPTWPPTPTNDAPNIDLDQPRVSIVSTSPFEGSQMPVLGPGKSFSAVTDFPRDLDQRHSPVRQNGTASTSPRLSAQQSTLFNFAGNGAPPGGSTTLSEPHGTSGQYQTHSVPSSSSGDDPVIYQNARYFPPRLPTVTGFSGADARSTATRKIHSWITRRRRAQSSRQSSASRSGKIRSRQRRDQSSRRSSVSRSGQIRSKSSSANVSADRSVSSAPRSSSSSSSSFVGNVAQLWRQIEESRSKIREYKAKMYRERSEMKTLRPRILDADNAFMNNIRPMLVIRTALSHTSKDQVDAQFMEMQNLRIEYQALESRCEELEDCIDEEEAELSLLEVHFFSRLGWDDEDDRSSSSAGNKIAVDTPHELRGISAERPIEDLHPLYNDLTFAVARLRGAEEELSGLRTTKQNFEEDVEVNERTGQRVQSQVANFLSEYPKLEKPVTETITGCKKQIQDLKNLCQEKHLMPKHISVDMEAALNHRDRKLEDINLDAPGPRSRWSQDEIILRHFPILLSQHSHLLMSPLPLTPQDALDKARKIPKDDPQKDIRVRRARKECDIDQLARGRDKDETGAHYISRWLLLSLRISPFYVRILFTIFSSRLSIKNERRWQIDVLRLWYKDGMGTETELYEDMSLQVGHSGPGRSRRASEGATEGSVSWGGSRAGTGTSRSMPDLPSLSIGVEQ